MALLNINKGRTKSELESGNEIQSSNRAGDSFYDFSRTDFARNNLFLFDDSINQGPKPIFYLRGTFPYLELDTWDHVRGNSKKYYPNVTDVNQIEVEFYESADSRAWQYFEDWRQLIYYQGGPTYNLPSVFKKDVNAYRVEMRSGDPDEIRKVFGLRYLGIFPLSISPWSPDYSDSEIVKYTVTFSVDDVNPMMPGGGDVKVPYVADTEEMRQRAEAAALEQTGDTRARIEANRTIREQVGRAVGIGLSFQEAVEFPGRQVSRVQGGDETVATSLFFSEGRNFTNSGLNQQLFGL